MDALKNMLLSKEKFVQFFLLGFPKTILSIVWQIHATYYQH